MNSVMPIWKPIGWTPLKTVLVFKEKYPEYRDLTISYAGRLDPMAEGVLLLLVGEENKRRKEYEEFEKVYEAEVVLGITTDTFDSLGVVESFNKFMSTHELEENLQAFKGKRLQKFPPYSSKTVGGRPLFWWARHKRIAEIKIPEHEIEIYSISIEKQYLLEVKEMCLSIIEKINKVEGDFRQKESARGWDRLSLENGKEKVCVLKIKVSCSSGTYVRQLASDMGKKLKCGAFALSIKRMAVGHYTKKRSVLFPGTSPRI